MRDEPAAAGVMRRGCVGHEWELLAARIRALATRLGYEVLEILDADTVGDLIERVQQLDVDAVIAPTVEHLALDGLARLCEVITLDPPQLHYRDGRTEPLP